MTSSPLFRIHETFKPARTIANLQMIDPVEDLFLEFFQLPNAIRVVTVRTRFNRALQ